MANAKVVFTLKKVKKIVIDTLKEMLNIFPDLQDKDTSDEVEKLEKINRIDSFVPMNHTGFDSGYDVEFISLIDRKIPAELSADPLLYTQGGQKRDVAKISQTIFKFIENYEKG